MGFELVIGFTEHTICDYTLQITITQRLVFSVTVFTALLGNVLQLWTVLCFQAGAHLTTTSYTLLTAVSKLSISANGSWSTLHSLSKDPTENTSPNSSSTVASHSYQHGPHREHRFLQLLQYCESQRRYLAMAVSLAPQFWL
jgi:hypothetical protein